MRWFGLSFAPFSKHNERFARQYRYSTRASPAFALHKLRSPSRNYTQQDTTHKHTYTHIHMHRSIYPYVNISKQIYMYKFVNIFMYICLCLCLSVCVCMCLCLCLSVAALVSLHPCAPVRACAPCVPVATQQHIPRVLPKKIGTRVMNNVAAAFTAVMNSTAVSRAEEQSLVTQSSPVKRFITDCDDEDGLADMRSKTLEGTHPELEKTRGRETAHPRQGGGSVGILPKRR